MESSEGGTGAAARRRESGERGALDEGCASEDSFENLEFMARNVLERFSGVFESAPAPTEGAVSPTRLGAAESEDGDVLSRWRQQREEVELELARLSQGSAGGGAARLSPRRPRSPSTPHFAPCSPGCCYSIFGVTEYIRFYKYAR